MTTRECPFAHAPALLRVTVRDTRTEVFCPGCGVRLWLSHRLKQTYAPTRDIVLMELERAFSLEAFAEKAQAIYDALWPDGFPRTTLTEPTTETPS